VDTAVKAHGLDGALVEPDWPPLTLSEIRELLTNFAEVGTPVAILSSSPRPFSAASVVETLRGRVFIKRHARLVRDIDGLAEEHCFMQHLRANDMCVPRVFQADSGATAIKICESTYEVHEIPAGLDLYQDAVSWTPFHSPAHAQSAGALLARMHLSAKTYDAPARKVHPLVASFTIFAAQNPYDALEQYLRARPALDQDTLTRSDCAGALTLLAPFHKELKPLLPALPSLWTHNDLHASNLFWNTAAPDAHATAAIDFGLADRTNAVYDIAQAIERNIIEWLALMHDPLAGDRIPVHLAHLWALLDGYESVRPLTAAEVFALAPMLALAHAEFALTEAHYFLEVLHSPEKARVATRDYLVNHAQWFRGAGQHKILDPLRRWAEKKQTKVVHS
jgi:Ser/Thr protein kinase RdoA (MazF antagonist)